MPQFFLDTPLSFSFQKNEENQPEKIDIVGYTGKPVERYYGTVVVDLNGVKFAKNKLPVLHEHYRAEKVGFTENMTVSNKGVLFNDVVLLDTDVAQGVVKNLKKGFPYQASIGFDSLKTEELEKGTTAVVNGTEISGPAIIFREVEVFECSICTFGADSDTEVNMFSKFFKTKPQLQNTTEDTSMPQEKTAKTEASQGLSAEDSNALLKKMQEQVEQLTKEKEEMKLLFEKERFEKEKELFFSKLECSDEFKKALSNLYSSENADYVKTLASMFSKLEKTVNELGKAQGTTTKTEDAKKEPSVEDAMKFAKEQDISVTEAMLQLLKEGK